MENVSFFRKEMNSYGETSEVLEKILSEKDEIDNDLQKELEVVLDKYNNHELDKSLNGSSISMKNAVTNALNIGTTSEEINEAHNIELNLGNDYKGVSKDD